MTAEFVDTRVLGAIDFLDATTKQRINRVLTVSGDDVKLRRNGSNYYVIVTAKGLESHRYEFLAPPVPSVPPEPDDPPAVEALEFTLQVYDPARRYLPCQFTIRLPRNPNPASENAIVKPINVPLYPSPTAPVGSRWAVIRATIESDEKVPLGGVLIRVVRPGVGGGADELYGRGLSDERGEALIAVEGIPVTTWGAGPGPVVTAEIDMRLELIYDPNYDPNHKDDQNYKGYPDIQDLEARSAQLGITTQNVKLASGRMLPIVLSITLP